MEPNATLWAAAYAAAFLLPMALDLLLVRHSRTARRLRNCLTTKFASRTRAAADAAGAPDTPSWRAAAVETMHTAVAEELAAHDLPPISVETIRDEFERHGQVLPFAAACAAHVVDCLPTPSTAAGLL